MANNQHAALQFAEAIRQACLESAREGFLDASMSGLCTEGAMEAAISSIQKLDLKKLAAEYSPNLNNE